MHIDASADAQPTVDIIVVNWNAGEQLRACVASVLEHAGRWLGRLIVVDNGSTDGSLERVTQSEQVAVIRTGRNLGFARACNVGVAAAGAPYVLLLNPDTRVFADSV